MEQKTPLITQTCIHRSLVLALLFLAMSSSFNKVSGALSAVGVNYGRVADNLPPPAQVAQLLQSQGIGKVKLYDADPATLQAFGNTGIEMAVMAPDGLIPSFASDANQALSWVTANIVPFIPATKIGVIMVGNEVLTRSDPAFTPLLVPAMWNLHTALIRLDLYQTIKITTPHAMDVLDLGTSYPPSSCTFKSSLASSVIHPLLDFHKDTGSPFMVDAYPFFAYRDDKGEHIPLDYALGGPTAVGFTDFRTGLHYTSLLDAQLDAVYAAMAKLNHSDVGIVLAETGWPSAGNATSEPGSTLNNAAEFNGNLVKRILSNPPLGTPLRPAFPIEAYIFEIFNENQKYSLSERSFGLFYPDMTPVYNIKFTN
ncbi:hypothetical protein O6H91_04G147000 [Diphasiastrum complanatum]|uniref:Uncharacterized protein n=1 Tax=Diphasiastrum complanatum TaxID=34168 RepID=A0ACC2E2T0_DIPCM|nr:hypothetical protein O6H91_04G147000 [Diphasiastrum complanatum]